MSEIKLPKDIKRLKYFTSQFLVAQDFIDEQSYHKEMRRLHNRQLHTWGIVEGLEVRLEGSTSPEIVVTPGLAIDNRGREIVVSSETRLDLGEWVFNPQRELHPQVYVLAAYKKKDCDPSPGNGLDFTTRWKEEAEIIASDKFAEDEPKILLVVVEAITGQALSLNTSERRYAGLNPNLELTARKLTVTGDTTLKGGLTVEGSLEVKGGIRHEDWTPATHLNPGFGVMILEPGWTDAYGTGGPQFLAYFKDSLGFVHLKGAAFCSRDADPLIFKLQNPYKPAIPQDRIVLVRASDQTTAPTGDYDFARLTIDETGVRCQLRSNQGPPGTRSGFGVWVYLDGVSFRSF